MTLDFTLEKYAELCRTVQAVGCPVMKVKEFLEAGQAAEPVVVLRHDVDRRVGAAIRMAELESDYRIGATYYVRARPGVFQPEALTRLDELGHEVGYHYEVLAEARGDVEKAIRCFERELEIFREVVPVHTISMHGSPLSRWNNLDLWQAHDFADYDIVGDAVLSNEGRSVYYFTDTGRSWDARRYNLRDHLRSLTLPHRVFTTDDLIGFLQKGAGWPVYISAHPNRWATGLVEWGAGTVADWFLNQAKWAFSLISTQRN